MYTQLEFDFPVVTVPEDSIVLVCMDDGIAYHSGYDGNGLRWSQFIVDHFVGQENGICAVCGAEIEDGWYRGDGGNEVCDSHIIIQEEMEI